MAPPPTGAQCATPCAQPGRSAFGPHPHRGAAPSPTRGGTGTKTTYLFAPGLPGVSQTFETRCNGRRQAFSTQRLRLVGRTLQVCPLILCSRQESNSCTCAPDRTRAIDLYSRYAGSRCRWRMRGAQFQSLMGKVYILIDCLCMLLGVIACGARISACIPRSPSGAFSWSCRFAQDDASPQGSTWKVSLHQYSDDYSWLSPRFHGRNRLACAS